MPCGCNLAEVGPGSPQADRLLFDYLFDHDELRVQSFCEEYYQRAQADVAHHD